jgi:hypothetical protein
MIADFRLPISDLRKLAISNSHALAEGFWGYELPIGRWRSAITYIDM